MEIKIFGSLAAPALTATVLLAPLEVSSQPGLQDPSLPGATGILSLQQANPSETLNLLQGPSQLSPNADIQGGVLGNSINPVALESLVGGVHARNFPNQQIKAMAPEGTTQLCGLTTEGPGNQTLPTMLACFSPHHR